MLWASNPSEFGGGWELGSGAVCGTGMWDRHPVPVLVLVGSCVGLAVNSRRLLLAAPAWK